MELTDNPWLNIKAMMLFPDKSPEYREAWVKLVAAAPDCNGVTLLQDTAEHVSLNDIARRRQEQGRIIGAELGILYLANWHSGSNYLSASMVQKLMQNHHSAMPSTSTFTKYHKRYYNVLHLWAAEFIVKDSIFLGDFLSAADDVLQFSTSYRHKQSTSTLQDAQSAQVFHFSEN